MATYREIQYYVERTYGFVPHPCWIAEVKELHKIFLVRNQSKHIGKKELISVQKQKLPLLKKP
jgi:hypothetical protein